MTKTVFVSYSWDSEDHKDWVRQLADDLINNGINVILDQYDLEVGSDMTYFMEKSMTADKILVLLTPNYKLKADDRKGGVGFEYSMISAEYYSSQAEKSKVIPILCNGNQKDSCPAFVKTKVFHDMTEKPYYDAKLYELIKIIVDRPLLEKPTIGQLPDFETTNTLDIDSALKKLESDQNHLSKKKKIIHSKDGKDLFVKSADEMLDLLREKLKYYQVNSLITFYIKDNPARRELEFSTLIHTYSIFVKYIYGNSASEAIVMANFYYGPVGFERHVLAYDPSKIRKLAINEFKFDLDKNLEPILYNVKNNDNSYTFIELGEKIFRDFMFKEIEYRQKKLGK
jgi:hypothetical protein